MDINAPASFFRELTDLDIHEIKSLAKPIHFSKDELIFSQGDEANSFYIIDNGEVSVFYDNNGEDKQLCLLGKHNYFGEMAIYNQDKRSASVQATIDSILLEIEKKDFIHFVDGHPRLAEKINKNLALRNEELILRESLIDMTGLSGNRLHVSIKGDPSLRESAFVRERYESVVDKVMDKLQPNLEELLLNRCVYRLFINFNSGEIRTASIFDPFVEEIHTSDTLINPAYIERHFPKISYHDKSSMINSIYQFISSIEHCEKLSRQWKNIIRNSHDNWQPISNTELLRIMQQLTKLRSIPNFYLRNFSISMIQDAIRMQFNCDGTHIVSAEDYQRFLEDNLEE